MEITSKQCVVSTSVKRVIILMLMKWELLDIKIQTKEKIDLITHSKYLSFDNFSIGSL